MQASTTIPTAHAEAPTKVRWKIFLMMLFLIAINYIDRASLSVAMPMIAKEFDLSPATQGLLMSSFFWTYAFMQIPGGMLADRFGPRVVIVWSAIGWGFFQAIAAAATGWVSLLVTRLGLGAAEAPIYPAGGKLNGIWMTQNERGRGATLLDGGAPLGAALGALIIALVMLVDNAIVITEGMLIAIQRGADRLKAAKDIVAQTAVPLLGSTAIAVPAASSIACRGARSKPQPTRCANKVSTPFPITPVSMRTCVPNTSGASSAMTAW